MRWSATGVIEAAELEKLPVGHNLRAAAAARSADTDFLPRTYAEHGEDLSLAALAATVAMRRHARGEPGGAPRKDLRDVRLLIGSGGVLRHADVDGASQVLTAPLTDLAGGWPLPRHAQSIVDVSYVLAPAGLLASEYPGIAVQLLESHLLKAS
jgi:hypothetical protein